MRISTSHVAAVLVAAGALAACTPTTEDTHHTKHLVLAPGLNGIAVDAKQRFVWSPERREGHAPNAPSDRILCAEPSPDAMSQMAAAFAVQAQVQTKGVEVGGALQQSFTEAATRIGNRTATIQLLRDGMYRACEAYANGLIDDFGYSMILTSVDNVMVQLVALETLGQGAVPASDADARLIGEALKAAAELKASEGSYHAAQVLVQRRESEKALAEQAAQRANANLSSAQAELAVVVQSIADLDGTTDDASKAQRLELKAHEATLKGDVSGFTVLKGAADTAFTAASGSLDEARKALAPAEQKMSAAREAAVAAAEQAQRAKETLPTGTVDAVRDIVNRSTMTSTLVGTCFTWMAANPHKQTSSLAQECSKFVDLARSGLQARALGEARVAEAKADAIRLKAEAEAAVIRARAGYIGREVTTSPLSPFEIAN